MKIAIVGAGNMGGAIAEGLCRANGTDCTDLQIVLSNRSAAKLERFRVEPYCRTIEVTGDNRYAVKDADVVILAVKPWVLPAVIEQVKDEITRPGVCVVSLAGGVTLDSLDAMLGNDNTSTLPAIVRVIPNTAITVGEGLTFICGRRASDEQIAVVERLFSTLGATAVVEERLVDAGTALASCGIAYVYKFIQAMTQAGVEMGFTAADALKYSVLTVQGAAAVLRSDSTSPQAEIDRVTTPGGMTIKGINELERCGFTAAVINAILKPLKR